MPITVAQALQHAVQCVEARRLDEARNVCQAILAADPENDEAYHLLGAAAWYGGDFATARAMYREAVRRDPGAPEYHNNLAAVLVDLDEPAEAEAEARLALMIAPSSGAYSNLGNALSAQGRTEEALAAYRQALAASPHDVAVLSNLSAALQKANRHAEAERVARQALALKPGHPLALCNLAGALSSLGRAEEAAAACAQAVARAPQMAKAWQASASTAQISGRLPEAEAAARRCVALRPKDPDGLVLLASILRDRGLLDEAEAQCRQALELRPNLGGAQRIIAAVLGAQGRTDEALEQSLQAMDLHPDDPILHSNYLFMLQYREGITPAELAVAHDEWDRRHAAPLEPRPVEDTPPLGVPAVGPPRRRADPLRVGFVSADFRGHPVGLYLTPCLEAFDRRTCHAVCYSDVTAPDEHTQRIAAAAAAWRPVSGMSDAELAQLVRDDRIDVLVDLAGHTARHRLLTFARRPAPVQVTWMGYEGTTGLRAIDYLIADRHLIPAGDEPHYRERVVRLPESYVAFEPPPYAPPVTPLPALGKGYVTFASFNNPAKVGLPVIRTWAEILRRVPHSRLLLKYRGLDRPGVAARFRALFEEHDVAPGRIELQGASPHVEMLGGYADVDIALDPFPFCGGITTCDALWMAVPVVSLLGPTFAARHGLSILSTIGMAELTAANPAQYVARAVALAGDLDRLRGMRARLRPQMAASPLCDTRRLAADFLAIITAM